VLFATDATDATDELKAISAISQKYLQFSVSARYISPVYL
jgi:hypothetical protein